MDRNELILSRMKLVKVIAAKAKAKAPRDVDVEDLQSYGVFGLIDAIGKYDPKHGVSFNSYAAHRILGSIRDGMRAQDWVPRSVRAAEKETGNYLAMRQEPLLDDHRELPAPDMDMGADVMRDETIAALTRALKRIPERESLVLYLFFRDGRTLASIGAELGVTESRACQIKTRALVRLRDLGFNRMVTDREVNA